MAGYVICNCCGAKVPAAVADIGRAVPCPGCRRLAMVSAGNYWVDAPTAAAPASAATPAPVRTPAPRPTTPTPAPTRTPAPRFAARLVPDPEPEPRRSGGRRVAAVVALLLAGVGTAGYLARDQFVRPQPTAEPVGPPAAEVAAVTRPTPTQEPQPVALPAPAPPAPVVTVAPPAPVVVAPPVEVAPPPVVAVAPRPAEPAPVAVVTPAPTPAAPAVAEPVGVVDRVAKSPDPAPAPLVADGGLAKRIDRRTAAELQKELLAVREVKLDIPTAPQTSAVLHKLGLDNRTAGQPYPGPAVAARGRPDLAGLPFRMGPDAVLFKPQAEAMDALSKALRAAVQKCIPADRSDPRPDPDRLQAALLGGDGKQFRDGKWASAEAVPCVQQMLQAEGPAVRRMSVELLRELDTPAATNALVQWAVFDVEPANRAAAVVALQGRDQGAVSRRLVELTRYPWPRAAEHAAEALVALKCKDAVPALAASLTQPDPDAPRAADLPGQNLPFRRELVRVNHTRNCVLCHLPSADRADLVRGAVPDPAQPLGASITPAYYGGPAAQFVQASTTFLRQDFSVVQPVPNPGLWPDQQRYDYLVAVRPARPDEAAAADTKDSPYRSAARFALRELTGEDRGQTADDWAGHRQQAAAPDERLAADAGRYLVLVTLPEVLVEFSLAEFGPAYLTLTDAKRAEVLAHLRKKYGNKAVKLAVVTYLEGVAKSGDAETRAKAESALETVRGWIEAAAAPAKPVAGKDGNAGAAPEVVGRTAKAEAKELLAGLAAADAEARAATVVALGETAGAADEVYDGLAQATQDPAAEVRTAAVAALGRLKDLPRSAAKPLAEGLVKKGEWASVVERAKFEEAAVKLLAGMKGKAVGGYGVLLAAATADTPTDVPAFTLAKALAAAGPPAAGQVKELGRLVGRADYAEVTAAQLVAAGDDAVPVLIELLKAERPAVRAAAAGLLGKVAALGRNPPPARAVWSKALDALATAENDPDADVKAAARDARAKLNARD